LVSIQEFDTDELLRRAEAGQLDATEELFQRHRAKLRRMVEVRLDPRLRTRLDPSDVVQETLAEGVKQWKTYVKERPLPFYVWLRQIAWTRLVDLHRRHIVSQRRSVDREHAEPLHLSDESIHQLAQGLLARGNSPGESAQKNEIRDRVRVALNGLSEAYQNVLLLRHLEQLSVAETAQVLQIKEGTVKSRHYRALRSLNAVLDDLEGDQT
jgi:RNA polymerase sigma-70 factor (ECF subfamily)